MTKNEPLAAAIFTKACDLGDPRACGDLGGLLAEGRGVSKDGARAAGLFAQACASGIEERCAAWRKANGAQGAASSGRCKAQCEKLQRDHALREGASLEECGAALCSNAPSGSRP